VAVQYHHHLDPSVLAHLSRAENLEVWEHLLVVVVAGQ